MSRRVGGKHVVLSERTGRRFGTYDTRAEAAKRLRQIEMLKDPKVGGAAGARGATGSVRWIST